MAGLRGILRSLPGYSGNATANPEKSLVNDINIFSQYRKPFQVQNSVLTLAELSAKIVSQCLPYSYVEERYKNIPECVAKSIMLWSYPRHCRDIARYYLGPEECTRLTRGICFARESIVQVGFCVQGIVHDEDSSFHVCLTFDRCVITSVKCSCSGKSILWCHHANVLATSVVSNRDRITPQMPLFPLINRMDRCQLQKLLQYLLSHHCFDVPGIVRSVRDDIEAAIHEASEGRSVQDPTAFAGTESPPVWFLETENITKLKNCRRTVILNQRIFLPPVFEKLWKRTAEMVRVNDRNGLKILQCLVQIASPEHNFSEEVVKLWTFVLASPNLSKELKNEYCKLLDTMPLPNSDYYRKTQNILFESNSFHTLHEANPFLMPICAGQMSWDIPLLKCIMLGKEVTSMECEETDAEGEFIWREHLPTSTLRIRALLLNGYRLEAIRLAVSVARAIKDQARRWEKIWNEFQPPADADEEMVKDIAHSSDGEWMNISLVEHRIDPLDILLETLSYVPHTTLEKKTLSLLKNPHNGHFQLLVESLIVFFSQPIRPGEMKRSDGERIAEKWTTIISNAISGKRQSGGIPCNVSCNSIQPDAIRKLIATLTEAGPFTSCGNVTHFGFLQYNYSFEMMKTIYSFDRDLAAKFACNCLRCGTRVFKTCDFIDDYYRLLYFIVSVFREDVANQALDITLEQIGLSNIGEVARGLVYRGKYGLFTRCFLQQFSEVDIICTDVKEFLSSWLLRKLRSSLSFDRRVDGNSVLSTAWEFGSEEAVNLLQHWEEYFNLSEIPDFEPTLLRKMDTVAKTESLKLGLRLLNSSHGAKEVLESLERLFLSLEPGFYIYSPVQCDQKRELNQKLFEVGLVCAKRKPREFLLQHLSSLHLDEGSQDIYTNLLMDEFQRGGILLSDILNITEGRSSRNTYVHALPHNRSLVTSVNMKCRYWIYKLCLRNCKLPPSYTWVSDSDEMINLIIDCRGGQQNQ